MKHRTKIAGSLVMLLCLARAGACAQDRRAQFDRYMQASLKVDHFMGSVLIAQHGQILFDKSYGMANLELGVPNTPETRFRIGSNTKQFTAMAILELQERGTLNVQDSVCKYVPNCPRDWQPIKIVNLLTHTSGIPNYTAFPDFMKTMTLPTTVPDLLRRFENKPLDFKPGEKFSYSNSGYEVLGYIIQKTSGASYQQFLQKNIFEPLGMKDSGYGSNSRIIVNRAEGYVWAGDGFRNAPYIDMSVPFAAGGLYSTVLDLYKWDRSLATQKLVSKKSLDAMFTPYVAESETHDNGHYGFGWFISAEFGRKVIWHEGGINGFTSYNGFFPKDDACVIVLDNVTSPHIIQESRSLAAILFGQKYNMPRQRLAIALPEVILERYVGQYQLAPKFIITVTRSGDQLNAQATGQPSAPIFPESSTAFFYKVVDAQLTFQTDREGHVTGLVLHQNGRHMPAKKIK
jgi:CubicO group peptidase (beta-lactamase class C family)